MALNLNRTLLVDALCGAVPPRTSIMTELENKRLGRYVGGFVDGWEWDRLQVQKLSREQLSDWYMRLQRESLADLIADHHRGRAANVHGRLYDDPLTVGELDELLREVARVPSKISLADMPNVISVEIPDAFDDPEWRRLLEQYVALRIPCTVQAEFTYP